MSDEQAPFPGWRSGKGRKIAEIFMTSIQFGRLQGLQVHADHEARYVWFDSQLIGRITVASDLRQELECAEIFIEFDAGRNDAFKEIIELIISKLPKGVPCRLEDEIDYAIAARLLRENPVLGPY